MTESRTQPDPAAWLSEHGDYLYGYAMSRVSDSETARDLVQETLIGAWKARDSFRGESAARTWLTGILKHKIIDHVRSEIRGRKLTEAAETDPTSAWFSPDGSWIEAPRAWKDNPEELTGDVQFRMVLGDCISKLPVRQRSAFRMREMAGEESDTICKELEVTPTNLHVILHRARLALRRCLEMNWFGGAGPA